MNSTVITRTKTAFAFHDQHFVQNFQYYERILPSFYLFITDAWEREEQVIMTKSVKEWAAVSDEHNGAVGKL